MDNTPLNAPENVDANQQGKDNNQFAHIAQAGSLNSVQAEPAQEWPEPEPIAVQLPPVEQLTEDMLPPALWRFCTDISERMNCPPDFVGAAVLSTFGSIIGSRCGVKPKQQDDWLEVPNLWGAVVAPPSSKKTPACTAVLALLEPLKKREQAAFTEAKRAAKVAKEVLKVQETEAKKKLKNPEALEETTKELLAIEKQKEQAEVVEKRFEVNDVTPEKLADLLVHNPQGLMAFRDELIGMLASWEKPGNEAARALYLEAWNGTKSHNIDRIGRGETTVPNLCITLFGGIQPDKLQGYFARMAKLENDGLMQRFQLLVYPDTVPYNYVDRAPDSTILQKVQKLLIWLADVQDFYQYGAEATSKEATAAFRFSAEAGELYTLWHEEHTLQRAENPNLSPYLQQHFSKYFGLIPNIALIFHLIKLAEHPREVHAPQQNHISSRSLELAIQWGEYLASHAIRAYSFASNTQQAAFELSKKISSRVLPNPFTPRLVQQKGWHLLNNRQSIEQALQELEEANWIIPESKEPTSAGGRPSLQYKANPATANYYQQKK